MTKRRSGEAIAAMHRKSAGPMKHRLEPKGGANNDLMPTVTVHGVLAGAYRNQASTLLTHASIDGGETALCNRVAADSLCDAVELGPPTCPRCAAKMGKL